MSSIEIPRELYRYDTAEKQIQDEQQTLTPVTKLSWDKGIFLYLEGATYPQKGMIDPKAMWSLNIAKRNFIEPVRLLSKWYFLPSWVVFAFLSKRRLLEVFISSYNSLTWRLISPIILKNEYMTSVGQELEWLIYTFLRNMEVNDDMADKFAQTIASCVDYDNAYRLRLLDIMSESTKLRMLKNPRKELRRLGKVMRSRCVDPAVVVKFQMIFNALSIAMFHPKIKKAFKNAIEEIDFRKIQYDKIDRYWALLRRNDGYDFLGKTDEERGVIMKNEGLKRPLLIKK